ncbi:NADH-quinone oxidoreductase subunit M [Buchnera aphidicola]|uniref:NADH-quinone oxidoreductase subunit M n=1 Tax=Buchnera aphidicola TaxID=9 RepID=UPI003464CF38
MLVLLLIIFPFFSSIFSLFFSFYGKNLPRLIALIGMGLTLFITIVIWQTENYNFFQMDNYFAANHQFVSSWIPRFGIEFNIAIDGVSLLMVFLTSFLGIIGILCAWNDIHENTGFFYFNLMLVLTGILGVFIAYDLFLFFCFWELILVPMYFLIILWGRKTNTGQKRCAAANKFFMYTQSSGVLILIAILGLVYTDYQSTHVLTFNYNSLINTPMSLRREYFFMLCFFIAFAVKMPIFPFHGWLPDVHSNSPTCGALDIVGVLLKTAPYALLRYSIVLFPHASRHFSIIAMCLGLISIFYGAIVAFAQTDIKRVIAYSSISHMGLIIIALYSNSIMAFQGAIVQMLSNSITSSSLCVLSGQLYKRFKTHDIRQMGGVWEYIFWIPAFTLFFSLANLGLPGTGNFIGEFLILISVFQIFPIISIISTIGLFLSMLYSLNMIQKIYYGVSQKKFLLSPVSIQELWIVLVLIFSLIFIGLQPQTILEISQYSLINIKKTFDDSF